MPLSGIAQLEVADRIMPWNFGISLQYGSIIVHSKNISNLENTYPKGFSLEGGKHFLNREAFDFCACYPRVGGSLSFWDWDKPEVLGFGIVGLAFVEPYFMTDRRLNLFFRMGIGGALLTNPYDAEENPTNLAYSTLLNFPIELGVGLNYRLNQQYNLQLAFKYNHLSNGGYRSPNKGINFPTLSLGLNRYLRDIDFPNYERKQVELTPKEKNRLNLALLSGWSNAKVGAKDKFFVSGITFRYSRWVISKSALNIGTEGVADLSKREQLKAEGSNTDYHQAAILVGHEFWLGRFTFSQQLGIYYFDKFKKDDRTYQRYGLIYRLKKGLTVGFNLKTHRHVADFFDLRIGWVWL